LVAYQFGKRREPSSRWTTLITTLSIVLLITSTTSGLKWFLRITNHELDLDDDQTPSYNITVQYVNTSVNSSSSSFELTSEYYYESLMLLGIPIFIAGFFVTLLIIFFGFLIYSAVFGNRAFGRGRQRFEDDEDPDYAEEVADTYMRHLEPVAFNDNMKYLDCSICLKEFQI
jgi:hypothetical protein